MSRSRYRGAPDSDDEPTFLPRRVLRAADEAAEDVIREDRVLRRLGRGLAGNEPAEDLT